MNHAPVHTRQRIALVVGALLQIYLFINWKQFQDIITQQS